MVAENQIPRACGHGSSRFAAPIYAQDGKIVYDKWCAGCHGDAGAGDGYGSKTMLPHPRDFTKGVYKIRTTASGEIPTDDDLRHIIEVGMPGTAMPEWKSRLSAGEIGAVIQYIKSFSPNSFKDTKAKLIAIGNAPSGIGRGRRQGGVPEARVLQVSRHGRPRRWQVGADAEGRLRESDSSRRSHRELEVPRREYGQRRSTRDFVRASTERRCRRSRMQ